MVSICKIGFDYSKRNVEILKQGLNKPMKVEEQIVIIYCGVQGLLNKVAVSQIKDCEQNLISLMRKEYGKTLQELRLGQLTDQVKKDIESALAQVLKNYS